MAQEVLSMTRLILWIVVMAWVVFVIVDTGLSAPFGVAVSAAVLGAGLGFLLAIMFSRRARRKRAPRNDLTRD